MLRVLVAVEDFGEMVYLQILLSKLGFDVGTVKNPKVMIDSLYKLNPDLVLLTARGKRTVGSELAKQTKKIVAKAKIIMLAPAQLHEQLKPTEISHADAILDTPVNPPSLLEMIGRLHNINAEPLLEKYKKMKPQLPENEGSSMTIVHGQAPSEAEVMEVRPTESRYKKFLKLDQPPKANGFNRNKVTDIVKEIRAEGVDANLEKERHAFIQALFKKKA